MKKLFFKYFFYIFSLALLILVIQNGFLVFRYRYGLSNWKNEIYQSSVNDFSKIIEEKNINDFSIDPKSILDEVFEDNRISGYIVRNNKGFVFCCFGQTPDGRYLTSFLPPHVSVPSDVKLNIKKQRTSFNIVTDYNDTRVFRNKTLKADYLFLLPREIKIQDVIGSISLSLNGVELFTIDIVVYSPRTYIYSMQIINSCLRSLSYTIPVCILIAIAGAWLISSRNTAYISSIRIALKQLSNGKENVKIAKNNNSELNDISVSIEELDRSLQANRKSRIAWLNNISHDLNTPATAIKIIIDGLNDGIYRVNKTNLSSLQSEINSLSHRINKIKEFSTLIADTKAIFDVVDVNSFVENVTTGFDNVSSNCDIEKMNCDKKLMARACSELLKNAENACSEGEIRIFIGITESEYHISVSNSGSLPDEVGTLQLFEPWTKGDFSRSGDGVGLGLPMVRVIAELHRGHASIEQTGNTVTASISWPIE